MQTVADMVVVLVEEYDNGAYRPQALGSSFSLDSQSLDVLRVYLTSATTS